MNAQQGFTSHSGFSAAASRDFRPDSVMRYRCLLLVGFSGIVIAISPEANSGSSTCSRSLVRLLRPKCSNSSFIEHSVRHNPRTSTWSRLGPDLVFNFPHMGCSRGAELGHAHDHPEHVALDQPGVRSAVELAVLHHLVHAGPEFIGPDSKGNVCRIEDGIRTSDDLADSVCRISG